MIVDSNVVLAQFVKVVRSQVGDDLSDLPSADPGDPLKAVIQDIQSGIRPDYPYIVIALESNAKESETWQRNQFVDDDDAVHYVAEQEIRLRVTCYGDNATTILTKLRLFSLDDGIRGVINATTGVTFQDYTEIRRLPVYLSTDFIESAFTIASFTAVSDFIVPNGSGIIERVIANGEFSHDFDEANPITVAIDEP